MTTVDAIRNQLSRMRQRRYVLEKQIEHIGRMLTASMILRYRQKGSKKYESIKKIKKGAEVKTYAYLSYLEDGKAKHKYIVKEKIGEVSKMTESYLKYSRVMHGIRVLNKRMVEGLEELAGIKLIGVKDYEQTKGKDVKGVIKKRRGK